MSVFIDRKYLGLVQYRLEHFTQKNPDLYQFRCPYCHDSKKSKTKARGYIYGKTGNYFFRCHNCGVGTTFSNFLKEVDSSVYREYILENYAEGNNSHSPVPKPDFDELKGNAAKHFKTVTQLRDLIPNNIVNLSDNHPAKSYILGRKISCKAWRDIYWTPDYNAFVKDKFPDHYTEDIPSDSRIVLAYTDISGNITGIAGRSIDGSKIRYCTVKVSEDRKVFGLHRVDPLEEVYIVEGQFDSFFLDNCIASGDSSLHLVPDVLPESSFTIIFDNEPRNKEITRNIARAIDRGYKVVIFPDDIAEKDINDMVLAGLDVKQLVKDNTYQGASAMMRFIGWRK